MRDAVLGIKTVQQCPNLVLIPNNKPKEVFLNMLLNTDKPFNIRTDLSSTELYLKSSNLRSRKIPENVQFPLHRSSTNSLQARSQSRTSSASIERD